MSRLPIRVRLTAAFALAMVAVLAAAAVFVYLRLESDLDEAINSGLRLRADDVAAVIQQSDRLSPRTGGPLAEAEESFAQVLTPRGRVVDATGGARVAALSPDETAAISSDARFLERRVPGIVDSARLLARRVETNGRAQVVVVGASLEDRNDALANVIGSFLIGGAVAVLLASGVGYLLARAGLSPVEAMRRRAARISLERAGERLPLPAAKDEIRSLGETLNNMLARLQESFERERRFVADASHELRTPLAVVKAELEAALRNRTSEPEVRESLVAAVEETDQLAQLAEDLLLIARAADGLPVRPERVQIRELLEQAQQRFSDRAREHGRLIHVHAPDGLSAELDPLRIRQALGNLIDNALRHGAGDIDLTARPDDGAVELDVRDQGVGFPADLRQRAFERFARGDKSRARGGAGLGLSIVRAIAEAHRGTATIVEAGGTRTTVRLRLPTAGADQFSTK